MSPLEMAGVAGIILNLLLLIENLMEKRYELTPINILGVLCAFACIFAEMGA